MKSRTIKVGYLARVEGEGSLNLKIANNQVSGAHLDIFEPPRFFEAFLRGRSYEEVPDITARICGICPVAYQTTASQAIESACGVHVDGQIRALRRLLYCGEWIESHALHVYLLHAPDFLGYDDGLRMARDHPQRVARGLELKKIGNELITVIGGREIHPINVKVGGFYFPPSRDALLEIVPRLQAALETALDTVRWVSTFTFPEFEQDYVFVALRHPDCYAIDEGRIVSSEGLDIAVEEYDDHFQEEQVRHSTALHSFLRESGFYAVGPLARFSLNFDRLSPMAQEAARGAGLGPSCRNPFRSIIVRAVELVYACEEALRIVREYEQPAPAALPVSPRESTGFGASEAPRGTLVHSYRLDERGIIQDARIVPPTAQNLRTIERDLCDFASTRLHLPDEQLTWQCEQAIRNYDPCISCATHVLDVVIDRD